MSIPQSLVERYRRLFRFYDRDRDGIHSLSGDFQPVAQDLHARWGDRATPFPDLLGCDFHVLEQLGLAWHLCLCIDPGESGVCSGAPR
jgi:hypothetical protein